MWLWPCVEMFSTWPKCRCNAGLEPASRTGVTWSGGGGGRGQGALTQSQPGSSGQAPACSVMLYCVALEITETRHNHNQTVGSKPGKIRPVVVLLVIAFVTPDWKINSNEIHKIYLPSLKWFLFSSAWCCSVQHGLCGGSGKIGKLVWTDRLPSNQTR